MIRIEAHANYDGSQLHTIHISATAEDAARLPKSIRLNRMGQAWITFSGNGANGGTNETGIRRMRSLLKAADKNGIGVAFAQPAHVQNELNSRVAWGPGFLKNITRAEVETLIG